MTNGFTVKTALRRQSLLIDVQNVLSDLVGLS